MSKVLIYVTVRMASSRCPNKVACNLGGKPAFVQVLERIQQFVPDANYYFVNTSYEIIDDSLAFLAKQYGYEVFRGTPSMASHRSMELFDYLGMSNDDLYVPSGADQPFLICDALPFCKKVCEETGLSQKILQHDGTLIKAFGAICFQFIGSYRRDVVLAKRNAWKINGGAIQYFHEPRVIIEFPEKYQQPWPWNPMFMDFPPQVLQARAVYDLLYKGSPIDVFEIPALFKDWVMLANIAEPDSPTAHKGIHPHGIHGRDIQELLNTSDSRIVKWDGKEGL